MTLKLHVLSFIFLQGGSPSVFDRNMATKLAVKAAEFMQKIIEDHTVEGGMY